MSNTEIRPHIGAEIDTDLSRRFLLICFFDPNGIVTVWENIAILQKYSYYKFEILNLWPGRGGLLEIPSRVQLGRYAGLMIHPTAAYSPENLFNLDAALDVKFRNFDGIKILAKQDEHYKSKSFSAFVSENDFDILMTCIPETEISKVYDKEALSKISIIHTLTGYVSEKTRNIRSRPYSERAVDIAYRGSLQPVAFGRLGYEKWSIGAQVLRHPLASPLSIDISSRWEDRLSGIDWLEFLGNARAVLGVESGSNLFDFDGSIAKRCEQLATEHPKMNPFSEEFYRLAEAEILREFEDNVHYAQISPRHFEAAGARALQIMYEGTYSGIFKPGVHFFPLRRDMSNFAEAIDLIKDPVRAQKMIDATYEDIVLNDAYTYKTFVAKLDQKITQCVAAKGLHERARPQKTAKAKALVMCAHDPIVDPRIGWWADGLKSRYCVCELGTYRFSEVGTRPKVNHIDNEHWRVQVERTLHGSPWKSSNAEAMLNTPGIRDIVLLDTFFNSSANELLQSLGAMDATEVDIARFRELCRYFVNTNSALLQSALNMGRFDLIICADLESLPAAAALRALWGCHVVFDSHEYWPFSYVDFRAWENEFWSRLEARLAACVDRCITVSDTLAAQLTSEYGLPFASLPNATPHADATLGLSEVSSSTEIDAPSSRDVVFLFQGNFAAGRGLDLLIDAWRDVREGAILHLRGPLNEYSEHIRQLSRQNGTLNKSVFFQSAVSERELIAYARKADVGIIPYDSRHYGNRFACPNKLSQYMAAGLPILTNTIEYVAGIVDVNDIGESTPFHERDKLIKTIDKWAENRDLRVVSGRKARAFFENHFNWDNLSKDIMNDIDKAVGTVLVSDPIRFEWVSLDETMQAKRNVPQLVPQDTVLSDSSPVNSTLDTLGVRPGLRLAWRLLPQPIRYRIAALLRQQGLLR